MTHVETNVRVSVISQRPFRFLAEREAERRQPKPHEINGVETGPFYHLRVETLGRFRHQVVAYDNALYTNDTLPVCTCDDDCGCRCPRHDSVPGANA